MGIWIYTYGCTVCIHISVYTYLTVFTNINDYFEDIDKHFTTHPLFFKRKRKPPFLQEVVEVTGNGWYPTVLNSFCFGRALVKGVLVSRGPRIVIQNHTRVEESFILQW